MQTIFELKAVKAKNESEVRKVLFHLIFTLCKALYFSYRPKPKTGYTRE